jgi:alpha-tubulin suppressor-like RCC1 family protein
LSGIVQVAVGNTHACALRNDATVWCWGDETSGRLGNGVAFGQSPNPQQVIGLGGIVQIAAGASNSCALRADGTVWCWGANGLGQLGNGAGGPQDPAHQLSAVATPVVIFGGAAVTNARSISVGGADSCATDPYGSIYCWGDNSVGELGFDPGPTFGFATVITYPVTGVSGAVDVSVGRFHVCGTFNNGLVACWGRDEAYQLGITFQSSTPQVVPGVAGSVTVSAGSVHTCEMPSTGQVFCWGSTIASGDRLGANRGVGFYLAGPPVIGFP